MDWIAGVIDFVPLADVLLPLVAAALTGEAGILTLIILAAQGAIAPSGVIVGSAVGTLLADTGWFLLGRTYLGRRLERREHLARHARSVDALIRSLTRDVHLRTLIAAKFLLGTRILVILHMSRTGLPLRAFIRYNGVATALWLAVIVTAGWLAGRGIVNIAPLLDTTQVVGTTIVVTLIIFSLVIVWISKRLTRVRRR